MRKMPPVPEFDSYASNYDEALNRGLALTGEAKEYYAEGRVKWMRKRLAAFHCMPSNCLDYGCGTGTSAAFLRDELKITSYTGFDPSAESISQAVQQNIWSAATFTADQHSLENGAFDLAFCNGVFHHIDPDQRESAVRLVWQSLKPGGFFALWENNRWNPAVHYVMSRVPFDRDAQMLFPFQTRALLRKAGFSVVRTDYCFVFPGVLRGLRFLEPALCKLPLGGQYLVLARKDA
jgi:SAM-dependent methyltransferase